MRKMYFYIATCLLCGNLLFAQSPENRTVKTIVADVLAQMPAKKSAAYDRRMKELLSSGEEAVFALVEMINAPGKGSNASVDYAMSGLSHYVMSKGKEESRLMLSKAYIKALNLAKDRETKAFLMRQLQIVGQDEVVEVLSSYLQQPGLSGPAARVLSSVGTSAAKLALESALRQSSSIEIQKNILEAIAEIGIDGTDIESTIQSLVRSADIDLRKTALYALSKVGSTASLDLLKDAAERVGYTMEPTGANEAYIALIKRIAREGYEREAQKAASSLLKATTKMGVYQTRNAALEILFSLAKEENEVSRLLLKALRDSDERYRNAALNIASLKANEKLYIDLYQKLDKYSNSAKIDLINWIGRESQSPSKHDLIKNLKIRTDLTGRDILLKQLASNDYSVKEATAWALVRIGDETVIPNLAEMLTSEDKQEILLGQDVLMTFAGDVTGEIARVIPKATEAGQIAALELFASRKADVRLNVVLEAIEKGTPKVREVAYQTLKDVVLAKDFNSLCDMLEVSETSFVPDLQQAIVASMNFMPKERRLENVTRRMSELSPEKSYLYYPVLAATEEQAALRLVVDGYRNGDDKMKEAAFMALLSWPTIEVADILLSICEDLRSGTMFDQALRRYVNVIDRSGMTGENRFLSLRKAMEIAATNEQRNLILKKIERCGTFQSLLYAGNFLDDKAVCQSAANAVMNIALNHKEYCGDNVRNLLHEVMRVLDNPDAGYQIENIQKYLSETNEGKGFVPIFNGKDLAGWQGLVGNPISRSKMKASDLRKEQEKADEVMRSAWNVADGILCFSGKGENLCTEKQYGDFEMYIDWKLDSNGSEADAGIYLRGTPQVQIWDTSRIDVGARVGSGGLYNNEKYMSKPLIVADNKLGEWNTFYIKMVGDRVTVKLNGELIVDNIIMENYWDRHQPIFPIGPIELQAHGSKVYYRDIYVKELERKEPFVLSEDEKKEGFEILFDGTNMHEWQGNTKDYVLEDGCIAMIPSKDFGGNLYTKKEYDNFIFRFEFQLTPGANNGIGIRTQMNVNAAYEGMEIQVLDCEHPIYRGITPLQHHGSIYGILPSNENHKRAIKPVGEWNEEEIVANGDNIRVTVNGVVILEGNIREAVKNGTADKRKHPGLFNKKGYIGFLGHGSYVKFRNIRIKEIDK